MHRGHRLALWGVVAVAMAIGKNTWPMQFLSLAERTGESHIMTRQKNIETI